MSINTVAGHYDRLVKEAMPPGASKIQLRESRRMFYAGAAAVLDMMLHNIAAPELSEAAGVHMIDGLHKEVTAFMREVMAGRS